MKKDILQTNLLGRLRGLFPNKAELVKKLTDILGIEKEAVYRRVRGEVSFSFSDVMLIASHLRISLDNLIGVDANKARPFILSLIDYETPTWQDYDLCEKYLDLLDTINKHKAAHAIETWNTLPFPLTYQFPYLNKYCLFKWLFLFKNYVPSKKYEEIEIPSRLQVLQQEELTKSKNIKHTDLIISPTIFSDIVNDIKHFHDLELIGKENVLKIKEELSEYINYLETLSQTGKNENTEGNIFLYVSRTNIDLNQLYVESDIYNYSIIRFLYLGGIASIDGLPHEQMKNWLLFRKRMATLITQTGEIEKATFFGNQRTYIQSLLSI